MVSMPGRCLLGLFSLGGGVVPHRFPDLVNMGGVNGRGLENAHCVKLGGGGGGGLPCGPRPHAGENTGIPCTDSIHQFGDSFGGYGVPHALNQLGDGGGGGAVAGGLEYFDDGFEVSGSGLALGDFFQSIGGGDFHFVFPFRPVGLSVVVAGTKKDGTEYRHRLM